MSRFYIGTCQHDPVTARLVSDLACAFAAGHRTGLIVASRNSPRFHRNTGTDFYTDAASSDAVTNTIGRDGTSRLLLPVD